MSHGLSDPIERAMQLSGQWDSGRANNPDTERHEWDILNAPGRSATHPGVPGQASWQEPSNVSDEEQNTEYDGQEAYREYFRRQCFDTTASCRSTFISFFSPQPQHNLKMK